MIKAALTGSMGSGKTTALAFFKKCGAVTASSDEWVHEEFASNASLRASLARAFGASVVKGSAIDRKALAEVVFCYPSKLKRLNALIHPLVKRRLFGFFKKNRSKPLVVVEVPLLFEAKFDRFFDLTIGVATDPHEQRSRSLRRGKAYVAEVRRRMRCQLDAEEKISRCDFVIDNSSTRKKTFQQINKLMEVKLWKS